MNKKNRLAVVVVEKQGEDIVYARYEGKQSMETVVCDGTQPLHPEHVEAFRANPQKFCSDNGLTLTPNDNSGNAA